MYFSSGGQRLEAEGAADCTQLPCRPVGGSNNNLLWKDRQRPGKAVVMRAFKVEQQLSSHASRGC